jgi:alkylhydroperoxidase family enzyme
MLLDYKKMLPEANRAMSELEKVVESSTLEPKLRELVKLRATQINGCAYCVAVGFRQPVGYRPWGSDSRAGAEP